MNKKIGMLSKVIIIFSFLLINHKAFSMCGSQTFQPIAWNSSGGAVIIHNMSYGPEGGSGNTYLILDFDKQISNSYTFSGDLSPGDGSTPESISTDNCKASAKKANQTLAKSGFNLRFNTLCHSRSNMLETKNVNGELLSSDKANKISKKLGISISESNPIVASKDGKRFVVIEEDSSCSAKCYRVIVNKKNHSFEREGECSLAY